MTDQTTSLLAGQCTCGLVRYSVLDEFKYALNCHCSNCRRTTGAAYKPFAGIEKTKLQLKANAKDLLVVGDASQNHDIRCNQCGSLLYSVVKDGAFVHVTMGSLVNAPSIRPSAHIFVGSMAPWHTITDSLPQFAEFPE